MVPRAPVAALLLAAGASVRMGRSKQELVLQGKSLLCRAIETLLGSSVQSVTVVLRCGLVEPVAPGERLTYVRAPRQERTQIESLQLGVRALDPLAEGVLVCLVDLPNVTTTLVDSVVKAFVPPLPAVCHPIHDGRRGHPVLFRADLVRELMALPPGARAAEVVERHVHEAYCVEVDDGAFLLDLDTPEDVDRWNAKGR